MAEGTKVAVLNPVDDSNRHNLEEAEKDGEGRAETEGDKRGGLSPSQREVLERCLHALIHAKNDSHTLAALLLITRLCPASQLDKPTLRRIFEAVGLNLPARLLVTAVRGSETTSLPPEELLSLGTALLAALSTDPDMASHPHLLSTVPLLLGILANGPTWSPGEGAGQDAAAEPRTGWKEDDDDDDDDGSRREDAEAHRDTSTTPRLDEAMAADCYQILAAVCALQSGPEQLLSRGAVPALCRALQNNQVFSREKGLPLLGCLLSARTREKAWSKHPAQLLSLLVSVSRDFCQAKERARLDKCAQLPQFLPPPGMATESGELKEVVSSLWVELRPMMQSKLTPRQIGPILVLCACLLDLCGWESAGPPKFCCLLVNRACVEVRMALEEPPGTDLSPELQQTLTGCYRIMEAAMEQACNQVVVQSAAPPQTAISGLSLQQSQQVLGVLQEAFSALIYHLQQVDPSRYGDPFVFATFRSLCSWLAEETSCLKEEVTALLPFLISYAKVHLADEGTDKGLSNWMSEMSVGEKDGAWPGSQALRYLLPALCHLSAEEGPRETLLALDTPALLVDFLLRSWGGLKGKAGAASLRQPSMETACSALLNFTVTEPDRVRKDPCFRTLESLLSNALPVLVHKPCLLVLAANFCTLGLMIGRLKPAASGPAESGQRRFFSAALCFLRGALGPGSRPGPVVVSPAWEEWWEEAQELWRLGLQALGGCVRAQPWISVLVREEGWLRQTLALLETGARLPDQHTQEALEEALCALAEQCPLCRQEISGLMGTEKEEGALSCMGNLRKSVGVK